MLERCAVYLWMLGLLVGCIGWFWLVAAAFQVRWPWGVAAWLFPFTAPVFVARHYTSAKGPLLVLVLAGLIFATSIGLRYHQRKRIDVIRFHSNVPSANCYLDIADLEKFRPGRSQSDTLTDPGWRGQFLMACGQKGH